jgi:hypothetical protein
MRKKSKLEQQVCSDYCTYYKPDKNEALACRGYVVVEQLLHDGKNLVLDGHQREFEPEAAEQIVNAMCSTCDFFEQDCDFMQNRAARPCGGLVLLAQLLKAGMITVEDIMRTGYLHS